MFRSQSWAVISAVALLCLTAGAGGVPAAQADDAHPDPIRQVATPTDGNETQQENPDEVESGEYSDETAAWLARYLGTKLENSTISLSDGQYEQARELLGDDYDDRLEQYVEVAGDTESDADVTVASDFEAARDNQRTFTNEVQRYRSQYAEYQDARESGNEEQARIVAREMEQTASNITDSRQRLNRNYDQVENTTSINLDQGQAQINETTANVTAIQSSVREESLVGTTLTVRAASETASFTAPGTITGQIRTENGSALANELIKLRIENRTRTVQTDSSGSFETEYRPRSVRLGQQSIEVEYVPVPESVYLTDGDNVTIAVRQSTPEVTINRAPESVAYGDPLSVSASVTVGSTAVQGIPVEIVVGDTVLARLATGENGSFLSSTAFPASVNNGERSVVVRVPYEDRAIAGASTEDPLVISETATDLSLTASAADSGVRARGQLQTADGRPVPNRPIRIQIGDSDTQLVETDENGSFQTLVDTTTASEGTVTVSARYAEPASNLGNASATSTVSPQAANGGQPIGSDTDTDLFTETLWALLLGSDGDSELGFGNGVSVILIILGGSALVLTLVGVAWLVVSRLDQSTIKARFVTDTSDESTVNSPETPPEHPTDPAFDVKPEPTDLSFDEHVDAYLDNGEYDAAATLAYDAVYDALTAEHGIQENVTHGELLRKSRENGMDSGQTESIQTVVEAFETAAFAPASVDASRAESAVESARELRTNRS